MKNIILMTLINSVCKTDSEIWLQISSETYDDDDYPVEQTGPCVDCLHFAWIWPYCTCFVLRALSCGEDDLSGGSCGTPCENPDAELLLEPWLWGSAHLPSYAGVVVKGKWITCQFIFKVFLPEEWPMCALLGKLLQYFIVMFVWQ